MYVEDEQWKDLFNFRQMVLLFPLYPLHHYLPYFAIVTKKRKLNTR